jgi:hypothetical protein
VHADALRDLLHGAWQGAKDRPKASTRKPRAKKATR